MPMSCCWRQLLPSSLWTWVLLVARSSFPLLSVTSPGEALAQLKDTTLAAYPPELPGLYLLHHPMRWTGSSSEVSQHSCSAQGDRDRTVASQTSWAGEDTACSGPHPTGPGCLRLLEVTQDRCRDHPYQGCLCSP